MQDQHTAPRTVELWIRSFAPLSTGSRRDRTLERVKTLEARGVIEDVEIGVWGKAIARSRAHRQVPQLERIERRLVAFEEWAERTDRQLEPFFRRRRIESTITGESCEVSRLPTIALAEFEGNRLVHVAPSRDGVRTIGVFDRLEALAEGDDSTVRFDSNFGQRETDDRSDIRRRTRRRRRLGPASGPG